MKVPPNGVEQGRDFCLSDERKMTKKVSQTQEGDFFNESGSPVRSPKINSTMRCAALIRHDSADGEARNVTRTHTARSPQDSVQIDRRGDVP